MPARPARSLPAPFDILQVLDEESRARAVDVEAVAHAAADRDPPPTADRDTRVAIRRLMSLVEMTHAGIVALIGHVDAVTAVAMGLDGGDEPTDPDPTPIPQ